MKIAPSGSVSWGLLNLLAGCFSGIRGYVLSVFSRGECAFCHQSALFDAFRGNSRSIFGGSPSAVIPLLASQDLMPMLSSI